MLEREHPELSMKIQAELLSISRSSLYYHAAAPSEREVAIKHEIDKIYTDHPFYGSRRITAVLNRAKMVVTRPTVQAYMREMGIAGICPGPNLSKRNLEHRIYPYLLRGIKAEGPNHIWGVDITYIRMNGGWMYLIAVLDWYSRFVVAWELDQTLAMPFVMRAVESALVYSTPKIWNSDQGSHFTSQIYIDRLLAAGTQISMDGRGRAMDNIFTERLWRSVKYEEVYLHEYRSPREAHAGIDRYINFYNYERPHQSLDYKTPAEIYAPPAGNMLQSTLTKECTLK